MSGHPRDGGPRSPHGVNSNPMPGENEGQINSAGATSSLAWRSAKLSKLNKNVTLQPTLTYTIRHSSTRETPVTQRLHKWSCTSGVFFDLGS